MLLVKRFLRRWSWLFGIFVLLGIGLRAAEHGLLGLEAHDWVRICKTDFASCPDATSWFVRFAVQQVTDVFNKVIDALRPHLHSLIALGSLSFAIWKWWRYREAALFRRLKEFVEKEVVNLRTGRTDLLDIICRPSPGQVVAAVPLFSEPRLQTVFFKRHWGWVLSSKDPVTRTERRLDRALEKIDKQLAWTKMRETHFREQRATAHLIKGAIASARSERATSAQNWWRLNRDALAQFRSVLSEPDNENDIEAIEYSGHQYWRLAVLDKALDSFEKMGKLAATIKADKLEGQLKRDLALARAKRYQAEIRRLQRAYGVSNRLLSSALKDLEAHVPLLGRHLLEQGYTNELQGHVRLALNFADAAKDSFKAADADYQKLVDHYDPQKQSSLARALRRLQRIFHDDGTEQLLKDAEDGLARVQPIIQERWPN